MSPVFRLLDIYIERVYWHKH